MDMVGEVAWTVVLGFGISAGIVAVAAAATWFVIAGPRLW